MQRPAPLPWGNTGTSTGSWTNRPRNRRYDEDPRAPSRKSRPVAGGLARMSRRRGSHEVDAMVPTTQVVEQGLGFGPTVDDDEHARGLIGAALDNGERFGRSCVR